MYSDQMGEWFEAQNERLRRRARLHAGTVVSLCLIAVLVAIVVAEYVR